MCELIREKSRSDEGTLNRIERERESKKEEYREERLPPSGGVRASLVFGVCVCAESSVRVCLVKCGCHTCGCCLQKKIDEPFLSSLAPGMEWYTIT